MRQPEGSTGAARSVFVPLCATAGAAFVLTGCLNLNPIPEEFPSRTDDDSSSVVVETPVVPQPETPDSNTGGPRTDGEQSVGLGGPAPDEVGDAGAAEPDASSGDAADEEDP